MKKIGSGAEAEIFLDEGKVVKKRISKSYRIPEIDFVLRKNRTRIEAKILEKIPVPAPKLISNDKTETIEMEYVEGEKVRDVLEKNPKICIEIGKKLALMHDAGIIHGDLTTSNMILKDEVFFIDFGLSFFSEKTEDKAVDIHLFKQALKSKHHMVFDKAYEYFLKGYKLTKEFDSIMNRLDMVELRGRYKKK